MSGSGAAELVEQARAIERPTPVPGVSGMWGVEVDGRSVALSHAQLATLRAGFVKEMQRGLNRANSVIEGGIYGHRALLLLAPALGRAVVVLANLDVADLSRTYSGTGFSAALARAAFGE